MNLDNPIWKAKYHHESTDAAAPPHGHVDSISLYSNYICFEVKSLVVVPVFKD